MELLNLDALKFYVEVTFEVFLQARASDQACRRVYPTQQSASSTQRPALNAPLHRTCRGAQKFWMLRLPPLELIGGEASSRVCIVTGPTSGIGWETAFALAQRGAHGEGVGGRARRVTRQAELPFWPTASIQHARQANGTSCQLHLETHLTLGVCFLSCPLPLRCAAVVLACRSRSKGRALKESIEAAAKANGQAHPKVEVGALRGEVFGLHASSAD